MSTTTPSGVHAIVPLAVLETVRSLDRVRPGDVEAHHAELAVKRLGTSSTVAAQIERFRSLAASNAHVDAGEVAGLLRLVGRRADAGLVFSDAGRRAALLGSTRIRPLTRGLQRVLPRRLREALGHVVARRLLARLFGIELTRQGRRLVALASHGVSVQATPDGSACNFCASAVAAILAAFTDFEGALLHETCVARGGPSCRWHTSTSQE